MPRKGTDVSMIILRTGMAAVLMTLISLKQG